jgi:hypothetical protein
VEKQSDECNSFLDDESLLDIGINDLTCLFLPESNKHICCGQTCGKVTLNISGLKFQTQMRTLKRCNFHISQTYTKIYNENYSVIEQKLPSIFCRD